MKSYRDAFGNPISKKDVRLMVQMAVQSPIVSKLQLQRSTHFGAGKVSRIVKLLDDAGVVSNLNVIIRDQEQATNAALRQLNRSKK